MKTVTQRKEQPMEKHREVVVQKSPAERAVDPLESPYIHAATSDNTRLAYQADVQHFLNALSRITPIFVGYILHSFVTLSALLFAYASNLVYLDFNGGLLTAEGSIFYILSHCHSGKNHYDHTFYPIDLIYALARFFYLFVFAPLLWPLLISNNALLFVSHRLCPF